MRYGMKTFRVALEVAEPPGETVNAPETTVPILRAIFGTLDVDQEHFVALFLDGRARLLGMKVLHSGGSKASVVDAKILFRSALLAGADRVIVAHNHPSGDPTPSTQDRAVTKLLEAAGTALDLRVVDHVILGEGGEFFSFATQGIL